MPEEVFISCLSAALLSVGGDAGERRLWCDIGDAVRAACCGVQALLWLTGEVGLYGGG
jgi:hypothetical protein